MALAGSVELRPGGHTKMQLLSQNPEIMTVVGRHCLPRRFYRKIMVPNTLGARS